MVWSQLVVLAPWAVDTSRTHSFLLRKTSNIIGFELSGDVDFCLLRVEGVQVIRIRSHTYLSKGKIVWNFLPLCSYIVTKILILLYHKLCFKTVVHSDLSQATDWNHMFVNIIINSLIFWIEHNCIRMRESKWLKLKI